MTLISTTSSSKQKSMMRKPPINKAEFASRFTAWKEKWHDFLKEKTINEITGHFDLYAKFYP